ncbi:MAG: hypothetical protein PHQ40_20040 [Anaerolineaceae bacterium]|nr:hypothetical protein [Anaerolineaceae bacterium]MDD5371378.1 hypothetical protein [Anaerolineaceae bacterium]
MNLINFIIWLSVGAVIGWFARRMVEIEYKQARKPIPVEEIGIEKS